MLLAQLKSGDEMQQLEAMMELSDMLSLGTEESLYNFDLDAFVPRFVDILNLEHNPDLMRTSLVVASF